MKQICHQTNQEFEITDDDIEFYRRAAPTFGNKQFIIPIPTLSPDARLQRRMSFRNERHLYKNRSALSNKEIVTTISPLTPYKIISQDEWWSDEWDPLSYGRDFDFSKSFNEQYNELLIAVPHNALYTKNAQNSEYNNFSLNIKDCYLSFGCTDSELCIHSKTVNRCRSVIDGLSLIDCELCYECIGSEGCYSSLYLNECSNCRFCFFCEACIGCSDCTGCFGLSQKQYCVFNEYVGKDRYEEFLKSLKPFTAETFSKLSMDFLNFKLKLPHRPYYHLRSENCTGHVIRNSKNCEYCFDVTNCEDSKYLFWCPNGITSYDCTFTAPAGVELCYEVCSTLSTRSMGTFLSWENDRAFYSVECGSSKDIFGCVGLKRKEYCIFNKQYSKHDYEALAGKIAAHMVQTKEWGEYLSPSISMFGYNQSVASEYFPLSKKEAIDYGYKWHEEDTSKATTKSNYLIPPTIFETKDEICAQNLICKNTGKSYRITPQELQIYRQLEIPIPLLCPNERHAKRQARRLPPVLYKRQCSKTNKEIFSPYEPWRPEILDSTFDYI